MNRNPVRRCSDAFTNVRCVRGEVATWTSALDAGQLTRADEHRGAFNGESLVIWAVEELAGRLDPSPAWTS